MDSNEKPQSIDFEYQIVSYKKMNDRFQGVILVTAHAGCQLKPIVEISTPTTFETEHTAKREASVLASRLIGTGTMMLLLQKKVPSPMIRSCGSVERAVDTGSIGKGPFC